MIYILIRWSIVHYLLILMTMNFHKDENILINPLFLIIFNDELLDKIDFKSIWICICIMINILLASFHFSIFEDRDCKPRDNPKDLIYWIRPFASSRWSQKFFKSTGKLKSIYPFQFYESAYHSTIVNSSNGCTPNTTNIQGGGSYEWSMCAISKSF